MILLKSFFVLILMSLHFLGYTNYQDVCNDFVDDNGKPLEFREIQTFTVSDCVCIKCALDQFFNCIGADCRNALKNAIKPLGYSIEAPFVRDYRNRYPWQYRSWHNERIAAWIDQYFTKDPRKLSFSLNLYSEYAERMDYLYYWFNVCCEVNIRYIKKLYKEQEQYIEKAKKDGCSTKYIKYLEDGLISLQKSLEENPKLFANSIKILSDDFETLTKRMLFHYNHCLAKHPDANSFYERGKIYFDRGEIVEFVNDIFTLIELGYTLTPEMHVELGKAYNDANLYNHAIKILSETIQKNPQLKEAYFERALAYFEIGDFSKSMDDYLTSSMRPMLIPKQDLEYKHLKFSLGNRSNL